MVADRTKIEEHLNFTRENYRMMRERLLKIIYWEPDPQSPVPIFLQHKPYDEDVIEAAKNIVMLDLALLKAEIDCGMYKKPIEEIAKEFQYTNRCLAKSGRSSSRRGSVAGCYLSPRLRRW